MSERKTEKYIIRMKQNSNDTEKVIDEIRNDKAKELTAKRAELEVAKLKAEIREIESKGQPIQPQQATGLVSAIIAQNFATPERAQAFLSSLDEESTNRLALLIAADSPRAEALTNMMRSPTSNIKDLIEIVKLVAAPKNDGTSMKDMAEVFKVALDYAKANQPPPQTPQAGFEYIYDKFLKPIQETMNTTNQALLEAKIEAVKAQMPAPLETQIANIKAIAGQIGLGNSGTKSDLDLKLEDMRQRHDMDMETIRWEKEKFLLGKESDVEKWSNVKDMFSPIFAMPEVRDVIRKVGESVGKSVEGAGNPTKSAQATMPAQPQVASFICPECKTEIGIPIGKIPADVQGIKCMKCGAVSPIPEEMRKTSTEQETPPPPEEKPVQTARLKPIYR